MGLKNYRFGLLAEFIAIIYLKLKLYCIIAKRYRNYAGEIDLIAVKRKTIIFIEVKARKNENIQEVITDHQIKRITKSATIFIASNPNLYNYDLRFDLIIIRPWKLPKHLKNAW